MTFKQFLKENKLPYTRAGIDLGLTRAAIYYLCGGGIPSMQTAYRIKEYTNGAVDYGDWEDHLKGIQKPGVFNIEEYRAYLRTRDTDRQAGRGIVDGVDDYSLDDL